MAYKDYYLQKKHQTKKMRSIVLALCFVLFFSLTSFGQTVNDIPIKDIDVEYIEIVGTSRLLSKKISISIDFGQEVKAFVGAKQIKIKDTNGKNLIFNSMIDALNFMSQNGYSFVQAYAVSEGKQNVYHYLMRKTEDE